MNKENCFYILIALSKGILNTTQVYNRVPFDRNTTLKYLKYLTEEGFILRGKEKNYLLWKLNLNKLEGEVE